MSVGKCSVGARALLLLSGSVAMLRRLDPMCQTDALDCRLPHVAFHRASSGLIQKRVCLFSITTLA